MLKPRTMKAQHADGLFVLKTLSLLLFREPIGVFADVAAVVLCVGAVAGVGGGAN